MSQQPLFNRLLAGAVTFIGLGCVWIAILTNLPSQQELSARETPQPTARPARAQAVPEPVLDLSIPGVPTTRPSVDIETSAAAVESPSVPTTMDRDAAQVARLRCEAEVEQLCPEIADGPGRRQCLERHAQRLPLACQHQVKERLVKWKEAQTRLVLACQADVRRFCADVKPGGGREVQCLQHHAQELSDRCYAMLPKGALYFKQ